MKRFSHKDLKILQKFFVSEVLLFKAWIVLAFRFTISPKSFNIELASRNGMNFALENVVKRIFLLFLFRLLSHNINSRNIFTDLQRQFPWWYSFVFGEMKIVQNNCRTFLCFCFNGNCGVKISSQTILTSFVWAVCWEFMKRWDSLGIAVKS